jgi:hypothetical protein
MMCEKTSPIINATADPVINPKRKIVMYSYNLHGDPDIIK